MSNFSFFVGCDISKAVIDVSYWEIDQPVYLGQFQNDSKGYEEVFTALSAFSEYSIDKWFICFENTGVYSKPLLYWLQSKAVPRLEESPLRIFKSLGLRRGKDDKTDSLDICRYSFEKRDSLKSTMLEKPQVIKLKKYLSRRDFLVRQRAAVKTSLKEQKGFIDKELYSELENDNDDLINIYDVQVKKLEKAIEQLINSDEEIAKNKRLATSVIGIGLITSAYIIATTNNFSSFNCSRKYACYCGVAPFPNRSGTRVGRNKVSHLANKKMKSLLSNCILSAIRNDPQIASYYARKIKEGKSPGIVYNAIKNKLLQRVFAVVNRQKPYVKQGAYAF